MSTSTDRILDVLGNTSYGRGEVASFGSHTPVTSFRIFSSNISNSSNLGTLVGSSNGRFFIMSSPALPVTSANGSNISFGTMMGIGTSNPTTNLDIRGDMIVSGTLTTSNLVINGTAVGSGGGLGGGGAPGAMTPLKFYKPSSSNTKTIVTNDPVHDNHIISTFELVGGRYLISGNIPYTTESSTFLETTILGTLGLYPAKPDAFITSCNATAFTPINMITGPDYNSISFQHIVDLPETTPFCLAIIGKGNRISLGIPTASNATAPTFGGAVPISGMGIDDGYTSRVPILFAPVTRVFPVNELSRKDFYLSLQGLYSATGSNASVYMNGIKLAYSDGGITDYKLHSSFNPSSSNTLFTVSLEKPATYGDIIDLSVQPTAPNDFAFRSGYYYQRLTYNSPWELANTPTQVASLPTYDVAIGATTIPINCEGIYTTSSQNDGYSAMALRRMFVVGSIRSTSNISADALYMDIPHPDPSYTQGRIRHGVVHTPSVGETVYRYTVQTSGASAYVPLPSYFPYHNKDPMVWVSAVNVLGYGRGSYNNVNNAVTIQTSVDGLYNVLIIASRVSNSDSGYLDEYSTG